MNYPLKKRHGLCMSFDGFLSTIANITIVGQPDKNLVWAYQQAMTKADKLERLRYLLGRMTKSKRRLLDVIWWALHNDIITDDDLMQVMKREEGDVL